MGVKLFIMSVILYETILISSPGALKLPFSDLVATVTPRKPKPLSPEAASEVPRVPESSDAILKYYKSEFPEKDLSSVICEFSSPLVLKTTSKALPPPKLESFISKSDPTCSNSPKDFSLSSVQSSSLIPKQYSSKSNEFSASSDLPTPISPDISESVQSKCTNVYFNDYSSKTFLLNAPIISVPPYLLDHTMESLPFIPSISSLPSVSLNSLELPVCPPLPHNLSPIYSLPSSTYPSFKFSHETMPTLNPLHSLPYPLHYNSLSLPKVLTPSELLHPNVKPISNSEDIYSNIDPSPIGSQSVDYFSPSFFENSYIQVPPKTYCSSLEEISNLYNEELAGTPLSVSSDYSQIQTIFNLGSVFPDAPLKPIPVFDDVTSNFRPYQEITSENTALNMYLSENALPAKSNSDMPQILYTPTNKLPPSLTPATSINKASPSLKTSSINNFVTDLTQNILSSLKKHLTSPTSHVPVNKINSNPYTVRQQIQKPSYLLSQSSPPTKLILPILSQSMNPPKTSPVSLTTVSLEPEDMMPSFSSSPSVIYSPVEDNISSDIDLSLSSPVKVGILPPSSFADYSSPQFHISHLPSPILPPFLDFPPNVVVEPQVIKMKKLNKNAKTVEKLLKLIFLAELINGDDYVDWDALDTVLALLCVD